MQGKLKVVFIADCLTTQRAGIHYYARQFIPRVIAQYPDHEYYHITSQPYELSASENIVVPITTKIPMHYRIRYFTAIPKAIKKVGANVAIELAHFGPFRLPKNIKRYTVIHDLTPILYSQYHDRPSVLWHRFRLRPLLRSVDGIITNSHTTRQDIHNHLSIDLHKIEVAYPAVQTSKRILRSVARQDRVIKLLTVGTIEPRKNHIEILRALEQAVDQGFGPFEWYIAGGEGWDYRQINRAMSESPIADRIRKYGYVSDADLQRLYQQADYLVYASRYEGFGLPISEAMGHGLGLILSDIPVHREVAEDTALYFADRDTLVGLLMDLEKNVASSRDYTVPLTKLNDFRLRILE